MQKRSCGPLGRAAASRVRARGRRERGRMVRMAGELEGRVVRERLVIQLLAVPARGSACRRTDRQAAMERQREDSRRYLSVTKRGIIPQQGGQLARYKRVPHLCNSRA